MFSGRFPRGPLSASFGQKCGLFLKFGQKCGLFSKMCDFPRSVVYSLNVDHNCYFGII